MRLLSLILLLCLPVASFAQPASFTEWLEKGKAEFHKEYEDQDYAAAVGYLEKAAALQPNSAEAQYFLGYAYGRLNSKDGERIPGMSVALTLKASAAFEKVIKLSPKYEGEMLLLDPYSKIGSEWSSLALALLKRNQPDSAQWAFSEARKRGAFQDFIVETARLRVALTSPHSILISSGDNMTYPILYLQQMEAYRKDVALVDVSLLNSVWYPSFLRDAGVVEFSMSSPTLDTLSYIAWSAARRTIKDTQNQPKFAWTLQPSYANDYLLRGDRLLLDLITYNQFRRSVFFSMTMASESMLSLQDYLKPYVLLGLLSAGPMTKTDAQQLTDITKMLALFEKVNPNSTDQLNMVNEIRAAILLYIDQTIKDRRKKHASEVLALFEKMAELKKYPVSEQTQTYIDWLKKELA